MDIEWRPIKDFEKYYEVSNDGQVRSLHRQKGRIIILKQLIVQQYKVVALHLNGKGCLKRVHRLVAAAFISNPAGLPVTNHIDGYKFNNHVSNLEWTTYSGNLLHAFATGLRSEAGTSNPNAKLTLEQAINIRHSYGSISAAALAELYGVSSTAIKDIWSRRRWSKAIALAQSELPS